MHIAWEQFTPWSALVGGALIGLSAAALLFLRGQVAGISGMLGDSLAALFARPQGGPDRDKLLCRLAFLAGLMLAPWLGRALLDGQSMTSGLSSAGLLLAGLAVGFGVRMARGCTSGHGVCGLARGSVRSLVATLCFMGSAFATLYLTRHVLGVTG